MGARTLEKCKTYYEGRVFKTNKCGDIVVINYFNASNVIVQFLNTGARTKTCTGDILNGYVKTCLLQIFSTKVIWGVMMRMLLVRTHLKATLCGWI